MFYHWMRMKGSYVFILSMCGQRGWRCHISQNPKKLRTTLSTNWATNPIMIGKPIVSKFFFRIRKSVVVFLAEVISVDPVVFEVVGSWCCSVRRQLCEVWRIDSAYDLVRKGIKKNLRSGNCFGSEISIVESSLSGVVGKDDIVNEVYRSKG